MWTNHWTNCTFFFVYSRPFLVGQMAPPSTPRDLSLGGKDGTRSRSARWRAPIVNRHVISGWLTAGGRAYLAKYPDDWSGVRCLPARQAALPRTRNQLRARALLTSVQFPDIVSAMTSLIVDARTKEQFNSRRVGTRRGKSWWKST